MRYEVIDGSVWDKIKDRSSSFLCLINQYSTPDYFLGKLNEEYGTLRVLRYIADPLPLEGGDCYFAINTFFMVAKDKDGSINPEWLKKALGKLPNVSRHEEIKFVFLAPLREDPNLPWKDLWMTIKNGLQNCPLTIGLCIPGANV